MDIKVIVATHKEYWMPSDDVYLPMYVGKCGRNNLNYIGDDTGDNISTKNPYFCELTGLYWAWKNMQCDYIGVCHYRRYFAHKSFGAATKSKQKAIFLKKDYEKLLKVYDIIVPSKRNYYIETIRSHYEHAHCIRDLEETERIIKEKYPEYMLAFQRVMQRHSLYLYNMFVMKKSLFDAYCKWLFDIEFTLENRIDIRSYDPYNARVFGFISERLFNVWLEHNHYSVVEANVVNLEPIHWPQKICKFLKRKFLRKHQQN